MKPSNGFVVLYTLLLLMSAATRGDVLDKADIDSGASGYNGILMLNQAAGQGQQQINVRAVSLGDTADGSIRVEQIRDAITSDMLLMDARAQIRGASFSNGNGVLGVNQGAGIGNQQINAFHIELGLIPESMDDSSLAQSAALPSTNSGAVGPQSGNRQVSIDDQAFADSRGVVQLNQSAGVGNRTVNNLGIRIIN
ncbi:MAG: adhesin [bacterium]|nr:adhesin [bacterium]